MSSHEEQPHQEKRQRKEEASPISCSSDDLVLNCLARVWRSDHAALSLVSKSYRSLVASPDLYKIRSLIGRTETYVYVCLRILRRRKTLDASDLIPIPSLSSQPVEASSVVVLDSGIYVIGGLIDGEKRTSDVWSLDCWTHVWHPVPSMGAARAYGAAGVVDGKIYVFGGCDVHDDCGEVFDPNTQTWDNLPPMPKRKGGNKHIHDSMVRVHKVYAVDETERTFYYSPREGKWGTGNRGQLVGKPRDWCMIDNLLFCLSRNGTLFWCEPDELDLHGTEMVMNTEEILDRWEQKRIMHGMATLKMSKYGLIDKFEGLHPGARMCSSGGNIVLFWDRPKLGHLHIWSAEISLERLQVGEIWGNIEWSNIVMPADESFQEPKKHRFLESK
ncbi:PREDICTED: F-box/kelch-repeat protein SKIP6-like [Brassica oleracea var. oleracea]|uniref:F-box/kelch-repeat protein SKIP6-like n=1 Tax=Brassica oleracea var. oleracea TaxID=109376 RepID=UPI0006A6DFC9|nr:PREDICTED: F-box/kelch-repeat protein SKIP6-like [Brassica oleracea var. oleracea]